MTLSYNGPMASVNSWNGIQIELHIDRWHTQYIWEYFVHWNCQCVSIAKIMPKLTLVGGVISLRKRQNVWFSFSLAISSHANPYITIFSCPEIVFRLQMQHDSKLYNQESRQLIFTICIFILFYMTYFHAKKRNFHIYKVSRFFFGNCIRFLLFKTVEILNVTICPGWVPYMS